MPQNNLQRFSWLHFVLSLIFDSYCYLTRERICRTLHTTIQEAMFSPMNFFNGLKTEPICTPIPLHLFLPTAREHLRKDKFLAYHFPKPSHQFQNIHDFPVPEYFNYYLSFQPYNTSFLSSFFPYGLSFRPQTMKDCFPPGALHLLFLLPGTLFLPIVISLACLLGFPGGSEGKVSAYNAGDPGSIPGQGRSPGEGNDNPRQYFCLENPMH